MAIKLFESFNQARSVLPNKIPKLVKVGMINVCVVRIEDKLIAFHNECPHLGASLHQGNLNFLNQIVCPLHSYRFDLFSGEPVEKICKSLQFIPTLTNGEQIFLEL